MSSLMSIFSGLLKSKPPLSLSSIEACFEMREELNTMMIDFDHYAKYSALTEWRHNSLHPCYIQMCMLPLQLKVITQGNSPFSFLGLVHINNKITQSSSINLRNRFEISCFMKRALLHRRGIAFEVVVEAYQEGKKVYEAIGTYLDRSARKTSMMNELDEHQSYVHMTSSSEPEHQSSLGFASDIGRRYAKISGDYNPIHLSSISARLFGFKKAIAHGMFSLARCLSEQSELSLVECDFYKPIMLPASAHLLRAHDEQSDHIYLAPDKNIEKLFLAAKCG